MMMNKVVATIERHQMLRFGDTVLVALSGGADSMALLYALSQLKAEYSLTLCAAHFNHKIRGEEAERDENFVRDVCKGLGVALFVGSADIPSLAKQQGIGEEECGRRERYLFFERVAPNAKIATAHTLSDCEETFLHNLSRGSTLHGLGSIPPVRGNIIRPLIDCSRSEIEEYCAENGIDYVTDSTNLTDEYTRNRIRHRMVPELKKLNPAFDSAFLRCVNSLREDDALLTQLSEKLLCDARAENGFSQAVLGAAPKPLLGRAVAEIITELAGSKPEMRHIDAVTEIIMHGGDTQVIGGVSLRVSGGRLTRVAERVEDWQCEMLTGDNFLPCGNINVAFCEDFDEINIQKVNNSPLANVIDCGRINGKLIFSNLHPGDLFRPAGRGVTKQLRRIFSEMHIPPELRNGVAVLRDDNGVVWVDGVGCAERVRFTEKTKRALIIMSDYAKDKEVK